MDAEQYEALERDLIAALNQCIARRDVGHFVTSTMVKARDTLTAERTKAAAFERALEVPVVWSEEEVKGMRRAWQVASNRHGHTETLFAVAAWLLRHRAAKARAWHAMGPAEEAPLATGR